MSGRAENWTRENLAWLAGLMEGEGSWYIRSAKDHKQPRIAMALQMTDRDIVERAALIAGVGGSVTLQPSHAKQCMGRGVAKPKPMYHWRVQREDDVVALTYALYPWMGERRQEKIRECLAKWSSTTRRTRSVSIAS